MESTKQKLAVEDVLNIFHARDFAYDILRRFFLEEPQQAYLKQFAYINMIDLFPFQEESEGISAGVKKMKEYLSQHDPVNNIQHYENLHWDYTKMFIGPFDLLASPWESLYVRNDKLLFQKTTMDIRKLYEKYSYQTSNVNVEADDHIGLELDFMYHLNKLCIQSGEQKNHQTVSEILYLIKEQQSFLKNHLLAFVSQFTMNVRENADTTFFIGLAEILHHFLLIDSKVLQELMNIEIFQKNI